MLFSLHALFCMICLNVKLTSTLFIYGIAALCVGRGCSCVCGEGLQLCELGGVAAVCMGRGCSFVSWEGLQLCELGGVAAL